MGRPMSTRQIRKRVSMLEAKMCRQFDGGFTLEDLYYILWRKFRPRFLQMVAEGDRTARFFVGSFEREDQQRSTEADEHR